MDVLSSPARPSYGTGLPSDLDTTPSRLATRQADQQNQDHLQRQQQRQQTPVSTDDPSQDLWSSILNSVKSSKAVATKNLVVLGEPQTGKSTLLTSIASRSPTGYIAGRSAAPAHRTAEGTGAGSSKAAQASSTQTSDLGLAYGYFDVGEEKDKDEIVARVGVYTLHSSESAYTSLLPFAFPEPNSNLTEEQASAKMSSLASMASSGPSSSRLADQFLPKASIEALRESLILILLDWEQPWTFLEQLRHWLGILHDLVDRASDNALTQRGSDQKWSKTRVALDEMKERLEHCLRTYVEPFGSTETGTSASTTSPSDPNNKIIGSAEAAPNPSNANLPPPITNISVQLDGEEIVPLTEGMLTENWGVPIVVVCTKSDAISRLERNKDFKEEQFDYIQQVLRTICMRYGAGLFYASSTRAQSIDVLRSYLLHRLFTRSTASVAANVGNTKTNTSAVPTSAGSSTTFGTGNSSAAVGTAGGSTAFPFPYRASTTDRDTLLVPAGWDSWGKIRALREPFDCKGMGRGWELDCELDTLRRQRGLPRSRELEDQLEKEVLAGRRASASSGDDAQSACKLYEDIVSDWEAGPTAKDASNKVKMPDEQAFLSHHHATLQKDPDPRSKFSKSGVVGPMSSSSRGLPSVEKIMSKDPGSIAAEDASSSAHSSTSSSSSARPGVSRQDSTPTHSSKRDHTAASAAAASAAVTERGSRPTSPAVSPGATSPGAPKQSEVLHSFFQSLLKDKGSSVASPKLSDRLNRAASSSAKRDPPSSN